MNLAVLCSKTKKLLPEPDRKQFIINIKADLKELSPQTIIGLGITEKQLQAWLDIKKG